MLQYCCCCEGGDCCEGGGVAIGEQQLRARSRRGGVSENQIAGATAARLTAVAIAIATRPFKFHKISVSDTSSSFVSSIHSFACIECSLWGGLEPSFESLLWSLKKYKYPLRILIKNLIVFFNHKV